MNRHLKTTLKALAALLFAALALGAMNFEPLVRYSMRPKVAFRDQAPPPAPDYADPASWSALPEVSDAGDPVPTGFTPIDQQKAPADVFYVHPTTYLGDHWNGPVDDPVLNETTDRVATQIQATAFNGCCAVYAPRYRQANGTPFIAPSPDGDLALDLAYDDVRRAFASFQTRRGPERPFILAAHSQGSVVAERLLLEEISGHPAQRQLVAAYLPGGSLTAAALAERAPDIPPCHAADDLHCAIAYNARGPNYQPGPFDLVRSDRRPTLCVNPLTWSDEGASAEQNLGAVFIESEDPSVRPAFADARCEGGTLIVSHIERAPRDLMSRILDRVLGQGNYHPIEYQIFFMNLRENANLRVKAMLGGAG